jgi:phosphatidylserine/phosphatidylglycerophosphate/cardiolipin synthase-like enzyme
LKSPDKLTLTLDSPPEKKGKREQTVEKTEDDLRAAFKKRMTFAWALAGQGTEAPAMAFPTSYHIKVAVKDSKSFWLSSGNWNTSNQPDVDPSDQSALQEAIRNNDRDWHVVCDCPALAKVFRAYLLKDNATAIDAAQHATAALAAPPDLDVPELATLAARTARTFFDAHTVKGSIKVKPLLTPDDYRKPILELLKSAQQRIYMQTQYIHTIDPNKDTGNPTHMELIAALAQQIDAGLDVRLIASEFQNKQWIEKLHDAGVDTVEHLRIQRNVHNKGIVVDSETVVVSSQNWSADGTGPNRDAGLIIYSADAAKYFESIFLHDWINLAVPKSAS